MDLPSILAFQGTLDSPLVFPNRLDSEASGLAPFPSVVDACCAFFCTCVASTAIGSSDALRHGYGGSGNRVGSNVYEKPVLVVAGPVEDDEVEG